MTGSVAAGRKQLGYSHHELCGGEALSHAYFCLFVCLSILYLGHTGLSEVGRLRAVYLAVNCSLLLSCLDLLFDIHGLSDTLFSISTVHITDVFMCKQHFKGAICTKWPLAKFILKANTGWHFNSVSAAAISSVSLAASSLDWEPWNANYL